MQDNNIEPVVEETLPTVADAAFNIQTIVKKECGTELPYMREHINYYWDVEVYQRTLDLSPEDKDRYFQMVIQYGDIIEKLLDDPNHPIYKHSLSNPFLELEKHAECCGVVVDTDKPAKLLNEFAEWKKKKGYA